MPPKPSYGLSLPNKKPPGGAPGGQKRKKTIFDSDSDDDTAAGQDGDSGAVEISTIGGLGEEKEAPKPAPSGLKIKPKSTTTSLPPPKRKVPFNGAGAGGKPNVKPLSKKSIFADEDDEDEQGGNNEEQLGSGPGTAGTSYGLNTAQGPGQGQKKDQGTKEYTNLSALHSSRKHAEEASELDPSIYSYDAVYESLHAKPEKTKAAEQGSSEVPRYMTSLLRSAEIRKRDQLRARDRLLAKEREAEGDEFADKEKFVTSAYKAQQEELRKVEEEEAERERQEEERRKQNGGSGMIGFYRDVLSRGEERHEAAVKAAEETARKVQAGEVPAETDDTSKEKTDAQKAAEMNEQGARIAVNEEGNVVDKRQLLSAGLNVAPKPKTQGDAAAKAARPAARPRFDSGNQAGGRAGQRARQTEMIAAQLEEQARQEEEAEAAKQKEIAERSRSQKTKTDVSSARERFLARKKEREAAKGGAS
ncbi:hypothetical protein P170DRAFT_438851 [Aspergillus steynii IBT 23096]|uniref:Nuclear speckle splicing regulatory protein 1 N-terminal domain-containing protein n=1 Tax=Aspergillus steynii IBT 23096 TaxID=1392250 RepID=A0A2I2G2N0_9EURO|nr:uncharacterized protein P170DRAFT_438851 [Aspergillus steynii IBT 23096]PLB47139.1 hypothetical protein P170DRAFT_438851 [Aspergillus steynii IBT 23096]